MKTTKLTALLCAGALVAALAACGESRDPQSTRTSNAGATQTETSTPTFDNHTHTPPQPSPTPTNTTDPQYADFCADVSPLWDGEGLGDIDEEEDPATIIAAFTSVADGLAAANPPDEIADEWAEYSEAFISIVDRLAGNDYADVDALFDCIDRLSDMYEPSQASQDAVEEFLSDHCGR